VNINSENSSLNSKVVYDLTKFTHLDYPNQLACIVWLSGCNMRCSYCYNADIVYARNGSLSFNDVLDFLKTRIGKLNAVVLSGGEATTHKLLEFCQEIKKLGFKIKLDTNGTNPQQVKELYDAKLLDFLALDYKAPKSKYLSITKSIKYDEFSQTLNFLLASRLEFEVRTTLHADLLNEDDINNIIIDLVKRGYKKNYYIQEFMDTRTNIGDMSKASKKFDNAKLFSDLNIIFR